MLEILWFALYEWRDVALDRFERNWTNGLVRSPSRHKNNC